MWVCACESRHRWRPEVLEAMELVLQMVVSHLMYMLGTELGYLFVSSGCFKIIYTCFKHRLKCFLPSLIL